MSHEYHFRKMKAIPLKIFQIGAMTALISGDFDMNISLSTYRAKAVFAKLVSDFGVGADQLKPFGAGPAAPINRNATEEGRAKNRRVEIVAR